MPDKIAISCIAWPPEDEKVIARLLAERDVKAVEIVPARLTGDDTLAVKNYRHFWANHGIEICAMQALLYGAPPFQLFGDKENRAAMSAYLENVIGTGGALEVPVLVFGSPGQRQRGDLPYPDALNIAAEFFGKLGQVAAECGTRLCIEPNPIQYNCDFVTNVAQALELVTAVDSPGFGLHIDAAAMRLAEEDPNMALAAASHKMAHFHISDPDLVSVGASSKQTEAHHMRCSTALKNIGYAGWHSIEMRASANPAQDIVIALDFAKRIYGADDHVQQQAR